MYKPPYIIQPSSLDFFGDKLHGTGKWTLHKVVRPYDGINHGFQEEFEGYNFYKLVGKKLRTAEEVIEEDNQLVRPNDYSPLPYKRQVFQESYPTQESVDSLLTEEAKRAIPISIFGNLEKKRQLYVIQRRGSRLDEEERRWIAAKEAFDKAEEEKALSHASLERDKELKIKAKIADYNQHHDQNELFLYANQEQVADMLQEVNPLFPYDFTMFYQVDLPHELVNISFEAPSDRLIPTEKAVHHSRGISLKPKTKTEINKDYLDCICGLAYVIASQCFNKTAKIQTVFLSAYVKQLNPQSATFDEITVYSIVFDRDTFNWVIKPKSFLPYESLVFFPHSIELGARLSIAPIDPLDLSPAGEKLPGNNQFADDAILDLRFSSDDKNRKSFGDGGIGVMALDERFTEAASLVVSTQKASVSFIQTRLGMGFAKAAYIMGQLETMGIVGPQEGSNPREVLVSNLIDLNRIIESYK